MSTLVQQTGTNPHRLQTSRPTGTKSSSAGLVCLNTRSIALYTRPGYLEMDSILDP